MPDSLNAFVPDSTVHVEGARDGPLAGLKFAAKDIFDVAGHVTGGGNPDWARTHGPALETAPVVQTLLDAGATLVGKTITDELARGILGINQHYGMPINPRAPDCVPGGSSSGSASVVAAGIVDFALGSDSGGSVRIPASYCGIYGVRPTHGRIPLDGMINVAPSFDTIGWFANDVETLTYVGAVLLGSDVEVKSPSRIVIAEDAFAVAGDAVTSAFAPILDKVKGLAEQYDSVSLCPTDLRDWQAAMGKVQQREAYESFAVWLNSVNPRLSYRVAQNFASAAAMTKQEVEAVEPIRQQHRQRMAEILTPGTVVVLPTAPGPAPPRKLYQTIILDALWRITALTCIAGGAGLPQVSLPLAIVDNLPVGLSLIGSPGSDELLLGLARNIENS